MAKGRDRFVAAVDGLGLEIVTHTTTTHTAEDAAQVVGAPVGAIVKSLLFMDADVPILVLASGPNRVDVDVLNRRLGMALVRASADQVKQFTGYSIGGVPPFGHLERLRTVMDRDFETFDVVWAAAGASDSVFAISPERLLGITGATMMPVC